MHGDVVSVLELKVGSFVPDSLDLGLAVGNAAGDEAADGRCDGEEVGDGLGVHESVGHFLLSDDYSGVFAAERDACETGGGGGCLEGILHLVQAALWGEN